MKKIAFSRIPGHSRFPYSGAINHCDGMPTSSGSRIDNLLERYDYTGNKGNMIHGEAPARIFDCDRKESCYLNVEALYHSGWSPQKINDELSSRFDLVVFSLANAIRPGFGPGILPEIIEALKLDFVVLGLGMQEEMPPNTDALHPSLLHFLQVCNEKAKVFAVRGIAVEKWLHSVGFKNAVALGCPSLFVYPENILGLTAPNPEDIQTAVTGGYINGKFPRSDVITNLFRDFKAHYVMQQEMFVFKDYFDNVNGLYNEATGEVKKEWLDHVLDKVHGKRLPFVSYRWFQDPHAWRVFTSQMDIYIGDRFHGGVVALQSGVPALIIADDQRVRDLTDYFKIPNVSLKDIKQSNVKELVATHLSSEKLESMKEEYVKRFRKFKEVMEEVGVSFTVDIDIDIDIDSKEKRPVKTDLIQVPSHGLLKRVFSKFK